MDGYCPLAAYLGSHGFCLELALRPGVQHSASETDFNLERVIPMAQQLSAAGPKAPILARLDSGFDSARLMCRLEASQPHRHAAGGLAHQVEPARDRRGGAGQRLDADPATRWEQPRAGKRVTLWEQAVAIEGIAAARTPRAAPDRAHASTSTAKC